MPLINSIPTKIPKQLRRGLKNNKYDDIILFTLSVFGYHKLKELINDPSKSIENRMDKTIFLKWADELKQQEFIEEYEKNNEIYYKITDKGTEEFFNRIKDLPFVKRLKFKFSVITGPIQKSNESQSISNPRLKLSYRDFVLGLLTIAWRLNETLALGAKIMNLNPDDKIAIGKYYDRNAEMYPERTALLFEDVKYTHKELNEWINRYANYFLSLGLKKGDVINVLLENRPELMFIIGAMAKTGIIAALINTNQREASLVHSLKLNDVNLYIIGEELIKPFEKVKTKLELTGKEKLYFLADKGEIDTPEGYINFKRGVKDQDITTPSTLENIYGRDNYAYIFTSGTTGLPKAVPTRNMHSISSMLYYSTFILNNQPEDVMYITLPLYHSGAMNTAWPAALGNASTVALRRRFSASNFWKDAIKYNVTVFHYIGEVCRYLLNQPPSKEEQSHNVYKMMGNGVRPEYWSEFKERFGIKEIYEYYGATEYNSIFINILNRDFTVGVNFYPHAIVKYDIDADAPILDENGFYQKVKPSEAGLLLLKILNIITFAGYKDKNATKKKVVENPFGNNGKWVNTGDMMRDMGFYHMQFVDRLGDTYRWKGENVSTAEVEDIIARFREVDFSSVYGVNIPGTDGKAGMASILATRGHDEFDFKEFMKLLKDNLPKYAIPKFLRFITKLSTTATLKIQKSKMKKEGFNVNITEDSIHVLLPGSSEYILLTKEIHNNIMNEKYQF